MLDLLALLGASVRAAHQLLACVPPLDYEFLGIYEQFARHGPRPEGRPDRRGQAPRPED